MPIITYKFIFPDKREVKFSVNLDRPPTLATAPNDPDVEWTQLEFNKCVNCPLNATEHKKCPPALDVQHAMLEFLFLQKLFKLLLKLKIELILKNVTHKQD